VRGQEHVGTASATTPILDSTPGAARSTRSAAAAEPAEAGGQSSGGPPADPITLVVRGITTTVGARIENTFPLVPDAPVTSFNLTLNGGPAGYLVNNTQRLRRLELEAQEEGQKASAAKKRKKKSAGAALTADATSQPRTATLAARRCRSRPSARRRRRAGSRSRSSSGSLPAGILLLQSRPDLRAN